MDTTSTTEPGLDRKLRTALEGRGQRFTKQRLAVYHYLHGVKTHPTADEVFAAVRPMLPNISLATVYKALDSLVDCGLAQKLTYGDGSARYDANTDTHLHLRDRMSGKVVDMEELSIDDLPERLKPGLREYLAERYGFELTGIRMELVGSFQQ